MRKVIAMILLFSPRAVWSKKLLGQSLPTQGAWIEIASGIMLMLSTGDDSC